jgi:HAE1 family hydrophobic/amphiphilic exporter-1
MAALFESFSHPFTILFSIPFALIGVFIICIITNTPYQEMTFLGILILFGIVVNNGIIYIDYINGLRRKGWDRSAAIVKAGQVRLRPILMTAITTILGILPMALPAMFPSLFGPIEGRAAMYGPIGIVIIGGLITSTGLTLILMPTIYTIIDDMTLWFHRTLLRVIYSK